MDPEQFENRLARALAADDRHAFGDLLEEYRDWLLLLARLELDRSLCAKVDPDDLVQEVFLGAFRDRGTFRGRARAEFASWLRAILGHSILNHIRRYRGTQQRDVELERSIDEGLELSSCRLSLDLIASGTSPSELVGREEDALRLARALKRLPKDYREVIILRGLEGLAHEEVAVRLGRGQGAVRMLWLRALAQLRDELSQ